jgi:putative ABC transport system substrate-binding protein
MIRRLAWAMLLVLLSWPSSPAQGQTPAKMPRIGLLSIGTDPARPLPPQWVAFFDGLRQHGYVEGQTIAVERRFAGGKAERLTELAAGLVQQKVDVIVVTGPREVEAAHRATTTIPIVTIVAHDLVATGLVASLGRPGGNITGSTFSTAGVGEKYVELLREAAPSITRIALFGSRAQDLTVQQNIRSAARAFNIKLQPATFVKGPEDFQPFFARAKREGVDGLIVPSDGLTNLHRRQVVDLAARYRLPALYTTREFVDLGGLMAYGPSFVDLFRRAPVFVDKILRGIRPAELPIEQPTKFELFVSLKTARTLGLTLPQSLVARAEEVIP